MRDNTVASCGVKAQRSLGYLLVALTGLCCGAPAASTADSLEQAAPPTAPTVPTPPSIPPLEPATTPDNLVAWASLPNPGKTVDTALVWAGLDVPWRPLLGALSGSVGVILPVIDWNAPINAVVALDPESKNRPRFFLAASVGLVSVQAALDSFRAQEIPVSFVKPGVHSVHLTSRYECFISRALGVAANRMVCSDNRRSLEQLHPYLTRGDWPALGEGTALKVKASFPFAWNQFGDKAAVLRRALPLVLGEIATGEVVVDAAVRDAAGGFSAELIATLAELASLHLELQLAEKEKALVLRVGATLENGRSWPSTMLAAASDNKGPPPDIFWRLPSNSSQAFYQHITPTSGRDQAMQAIARLLKAGLTYLQTTPVVQKRWLEAFQAVGRLEGSVVTATVPLAPQAALPSKAAAAGAQDYWVIAYEQDETHAVKRFVEASLELYQDRSLRKLLRNSHKIESASLPSIRRRAGNPSLADAIVFDISLPRQAPNQSAEKLEPKPPAPWTLVVAQQGSTSVVALSQATGPWLSKLSPLLRRSLQLRKNAKAPNLAQRSDLHLLRTRPANFAGFFNLTRVMSELGPSTNKTTELLNTLSPEQQSAPLSLWSVATKSEDKVNGIVKLEIPQALIRAIGAKVQLP